MTGTSQKTPNIHVEREEFPFWDPPYKWWFLSYEFDCSVLDNCLYSMTCNIFVCVVIHVLQSDHDYTYFDYTYNDYTNIIKGISEMDVKCTLHRSNSNNSLASLLSMTVHWFSWIWSIAPLSTIYFGLSWTVADLGFCTLVENNFFCTVLKTFSWTLKVDFL